MRTKINIVFAVGDKVGRWTITGPKTRIKSAYFYQCKCICGEENLLRFDHLLKSFNQSKCSCRLKKRCFKTLPNNEAITNYILDTYQRNARKRGIAWGLSLSHFRGLIKMPCHYCGTENSCTTKKHKETYTHNGVDRLDNIIGYTVDNCVPCCKICNMAKFNLSLADFEDWMQRLFKAMNLT
jgi:hypothetical protein